MNQPKVSFLTINFNSDKFTIELLNSIEELDYENFDVFIVDNGSDLSSYNRLKDVVDKYRFKINLIRSEENRGYTGGVNLGIKSILLVKPKYVFTINNDMVVDRDLLKEVVAVAEQDENFGVCGTLIRNINEGSVQFTGGHGKITFFTKLTGLTTKNMRLLHLKDPIKLNFNELVDDGAWLISTNVLNNIGYDESLFLYFEEFDVLLNVKKKGYTVFFNPRAMVWHEGFGSSDCQKGPVPVFYSTRNRYIVMWKHFRKYFPFVLISSLIVNPLTIVKYLLSGKKDLVKYIVYGLCSAFSQIVLNKTVFLKKENNKYVLWERK